MDKYENFKQALLKAKEEATKAQCEDFGTCNLDECLLFHTKSGLEKSKTIKVIESIGLLANYNLSYNAISIFGYTKGYFAACRTLKVEAFTKALQEHGLIAYVRYLID